MRLVPEEVHVVQGLVGALEHWEHCWAVLDDDERQRAGHLRRPQDVRRFVAAHALTRIVLGRSLGIDPAAVSVIRDARGKPALAGTTSPIRFSLSHAGDAIALAVAIGRDVGIDVEPIDLETGTNGVVEHRFTAGERRAFDALDPPQRGAAFFRWWTLKEAVVKALGAGLTLPLDAFEVHGADVGARTIDVPLPPGHRRQTVTVVPVPSHAGYAAAVAYLGGAARVMPWTATFDTDIRVTAAAAAADR
jgi:4'-phosphopantetheinyl transferase